MPRARDACLHANGHSSPLRNFTHLTGSAIPFCIHQIAQLLPLETILDLTHPSMITAPVEDKRTWRDGKRPTAKDTGVHWTATDIMTAYANKKGWVTAKAGRPDINRAGNASEYFY